MRLLGFFPLLLLIFSYGELSLSKPLSPLKFEFADLSKCAEHATHLEKFCGIYPNAYRSWTAAEISDIESSLAHIRWSALDLVVNKIKQSTTHAIYVVKVDSDFEAGSLTIDDQLVIFVSTQLLKSDVQYPNTTEKVHTLTHELMHLYLHSQYGDDYFGGQFWSGLVQATNWTNPRKPHRTYLSDETIEVSKRKKSLIADGKKQEALNFDRSYARSLNFPSLYSMQHIEEYAAELFTYLIYDPSVANALPLHVSNFIKTTEFSSLLHSDHADAIASLVGKEPVINGPNCWNSVLYINKLVSSIKYTGPEEFQYWLNSRYCKKLSSTDKPQFGDVMSIMDQDEYLHAMTWVSDETVFSKNTSHELDPYNFIRKPLIISMFRVDDSKCQKSGDENHQNCKRWIDYYRCHSNEKDRVEYENKHLIYKQFSERVRKLGKEVMTLSFQPKIPNSELIRLGHILGAEIVYLKRDLIQTPNKADDFFWNGLYIEINSLQEQARILMRYKL